MGLRLVLSSTISTYSSSLSLLLSITITANAPASSALTALLTNEQPLEEKRDAKICVCTNVAVQLSNVCECL